MNTQHTSGPRIHFAKYRCGGRGTPWLRTAKSTTNQNEVTCLRCLASIAAVLRSMDLSEKAS